MKGMFENGPASDTRILNSSKGYSYYAAWTLVKNLPKLLLCRLKMNHNKMDDTIGPEP